MNYDSQSRSIGKKYSQAVPRSNSDLDRVELSIQSEGRMDNEHQPNQRFFSFNQSFSSPENNDKLNQQRMIQLSKLRQMEDQIRSSKVKCSLWEKTKSQIINLSRFLKLSSIDMGCSDSSLVKEFFEAVGNLVAAKQGKSKEEKSLLTEAKRKEMQLFEKLVESNKRKYQLQQTIVHHEHEISKLTEINQSLRQKSRAQSTQRSSKIKEFHEETILTIHQKQLELSSLDYKNDELKRQIIRLQNQLDNLILKNQAIQNQLSLSIDKNEELYLELQVMKKENQFKISQCQKYKQQIQRQNQQMNKERQKFNQHFQQCSKQKQQFQQQQKQMNEIKEYLKKIIEENVGLRSELGRRADYIQMLKRVIQQVKQANNLYVLELQQLAKEEKLRKQQSIKQLLESQSQLKSTFKNNFKMLRHSKSAKFLPTKQKVSSMLLLSQQQILI